MSIATQFRWKRAVNSLRFLHEERTLVLEVTAATASEFQKYYEEFCRKHNVDIGRLNTQHADKLRELYENTDDLGNVPESDRHTREKLLDACDNMIAKFQGEGSENDGIPEIVDKEVHATFTKLFKAIATHVHPDKARDDTTRTLFAQAFKEAKQALDEQKYFALLQMAEDLDIELPKNYNEQIRWIEKENKRLAMVIEKDKMAYNYLFAVCDSDVNRDNLIRSFLKQLFDLEIPSENA